MVRMKRLKRLMTLLKNKRSLDSYWIKSIPLSKKYHLPITFFYLDRIWCYVVHGAASRDDYDLFGFYRLRGFERRNFFTHGRFPLLCDWFFPKEMIQAIDSRKGFAQNFKEFHKRDMLELPCSEEKIHDFIERHGKVFVKKDISMCGKGVRVYTVDDIRENPELLTEISKMDGAAEEAIIQHPVMAELNPDAVSTLRITTMVEKSGEIRIMGVLLRVGKQGSYVDNVAQGSHFYEVDLEEGIVVGWGRNNKGEKTLRSPTGVIVPGVKIPFWNKVLEDTIAAAKKFPQARLVGWDVAIGTDGPVFVEANRTTSPLAVQLDGYGCWNYLKDQR